MRFPQLLLAAAIVLGPTANAAFADRLFAGSNCMPSTPEAQEFLLPQDGGLENKARADLSFIVNCPISFETGQRVRSLDVQVNATKQVPGEFSCVACAMLENAPDKCSRKKHLCSELTGCRVRSDSFVSPRVDGGRRATNSVNLTIPGTTGSEFRPIAAYAECTINVGSNLRAYRHTSQVLQ